MCFQFGPDVLYVCNRKKVPAVPESLLKRRKAFATMKAMRVKKMLAEKKVSCMPPSKKSWFDTCRCASCTEWARISYLFSGPQSNQETDLQEGWEVPQGVQADVQAWNPPGSYCSQSGKLLCASWAQTGLCHQDQRVSSVYYPAYLTNHHHLHLHGLLDFKHDIMRKLLIWMV